LALDLGDLDRAQKTFRALLLQRLDEKAPITKAGVFCYLGEICDKQGETQKAMQMLERAIENDPSLDRAKGLLAKIKA
jgi:tetratricopeptide (TPR) repeat protein